MKKRTAGVKLRGEELKEKFREELEHETQSIFLLKTEYLELRALSDELGRHKGEDDKVWMKQINLFKLAVNAYQKTIIDLASYCVGWVKENGFLRNLEEYQNIFQIGSVESIEDEPVTVRFFPPNRKVSSEERQETIERLQVDQKAASVRRQMKSMKELFPDWQEGGGVSRENIRALRRAFTNETAELDRIRNDHLAHRFEKKNLDRRLITPQAEFPIVERIFNEVEETLECLWHVVFNISYGFPKYKGLAPEHHVRDFVDLIRFGSVSGILEATGVAEVLKKTGKQWYWRYRQDDNGVNRMLPFPKLPRDPEAGDS